MKVIDRLFIFPQIYLVGPMAAGIIVPFIYKTVFWRDLPKVKEKIVNDDFQLMSEER